MRTIGVLFLALLSNCMTVLTMGNYRERFEPVVYGGVRSTLAYEPHAHNVFGGVIKVMQYIDLPFSLVLDTIVLPVTVPLAAAAASADRQFEIQENELVRLILPGELRMSVDKEAGTNAPVRPFPSGQEGISEDNPAYRTIRLPVKLIETGVPGCYLHCAAATSGVLALGPVGGISRMSVGLIRVSGVYRRNDWYRHKSHQSCIPPGAGTSDAVIQNKELALLCNRTFPLCNNPCVAANHEYTLYYVTPEMGKVLSK